MTSFLDRSFWFWVILIHAVYFTIALSIRHIYTDDSYEYLFQAKNLKEHFSMYCGDLSLPIRTELFTRRTILYGFLLMLCKLVWHSDYSILVLQNVLSLVNVLVLDRIMKQFSLRYSARPLLLLALLLYPTYLIYTNMLMSELLLGSCILWAFYSILQYFRSRKLKYIFLYNLFLVLAVLTKPVLLFFWLPNLFLMFWLFYRDRRWAIPLSGLLLILAITLQSMLSYRLTGYYHYSSIKNHNLLHYNTEILLTHLHGRERAKQMTDSLQHLADSQPDFRAYNDFIVRECSRIHREHLPVFLKIQAGGMANFFFDPGRYDIEQFLPPKHVLMMSFFHQWREKGFAGLWEYAQKMPLLKMLLMLLVMLWNAVVLIGFLFFLFNRKIDLNIRLTVLLFVAYICLLTGPMGDSRFRMPVYPLLVVGVGVFPWGRIMKKGKRTLI